MEDYGKMMENVITYGALGLSVAMADETGMVDVLCQTDTPLTSTQIAQQAGLKERFVRELLGSLVAGGVVQLALGTGGRDGQEAQYLVPQDHRQALSKTGKSARFLSITARQFAAVKEVFPLEGPSCIRFSNSVFELLDVVAPAKFESLFKVFFSTPGIKERLETGMDVAEVGSGTGRLIRKLAAMFPKSRFTMTDVVEGPLASGRQQAEAEGLNNMNFQTVDACNPPADWNERFDWIFTVNVIHDLPHPQKAVESARKALKPGGIFSMVDECVSSYVAENAGNGGAALLYLLSTFHCIPESFQQPDSEALGVCWGEDRARQIVEAAGLKLLDVTKFEDNSAVFTCQKQE